MIRGTVWFLRGLNTQGDDLLRFGIFKWRPMHEMLAKTFSKRGVRFIPVLGRGGGALADQVTRAQAFVERHPEWVKDTGPHHFLGHSTGGLVGRALAHTLNEKGRIHSLTTIGTPHLGAPLAHQALAVPSTRPLLHGALRSIGYNLRKKTAPFQDLTPEAVREFSKHYPGRPDVHYASVLCHVPPERLSWPVSLLHRLSKADQLNPNDGLVEVESQSFGESLDRFQLDHLDQLGFVARVWRRDFYLNEFDRLCNRLIEHWAYLEKTRG
jgi:pimeloyl-ACP methyl ester carboxylesterase